MHVICIESRNMRCQFQTQTIFHKLCCSSITLDEALALCESHPRQLVWYQHLIMYAVLPYVLVFAFNLAIVARIFYYRTRDNRRITAILMCMAFGFVLFTLPYSVTFLGVRSQQYNSYYRHQELWMRDAVRLLLLMYHSILHFVAYLLLGPQFRAGFFKTFCMWWIKRNARDTFTRAFRSRAYSQSRGEMLVVAASAVRRASRQLNDNTQNQQETSKVDTQAINYQPVLCHFDKTSVYNCNKSHTSNQSSNNSHSTSNNSGSRCKEKTPQCRDSYQEEIAPTSADPLI